MKLLRFHDLNAEDSLWLLLRRDLRPAGCTGARVGALLQALETHAGEWMPDVVEGKRHRKYSRAAIWKALEERRDEKSSRPSGSIARSGPRWT